MGTTSAIEGVGTVALGVVVVGGTAMVTKNIPLTVAVGLEMIPVIWAGSEKTKHGYEMVKEALFEPASKRRTSSCGKSN